MTFSTSGCSWSLIYSNMLLVDARLYPTRDMSNLLISSVGNCPCRSLPLRHRLSISSKESSRIHLIPRGAREASRQCFRCRCYQRLWYCSTARLSSPVYAPRLPHNSYSRMSRWCSGYTGLHHKLWCAFPSGGTGLRALAACSRAF